MGEVEGRTSEGAPYPMTSQLLGCLVSETQSKLNCAGETCLMVHHPESWPKAHPRLGKLWVIEQVEYLSAKLQPGPLGYVE